jgi:phosphatidylserine/phosphatidylglycerophosphate/cardiolipin synthase-like enzyme
MSASNFQLAYQWLIPGDPSGKTSPFFPGSHYSKLEQAVPPGQPLDNNCKVTPLLGGREAFDAIVNAFQAAIDSASAHQNDKAFGQRGYVYIAGYRLNPNRILTDAGATIWNFISKLMNAGVRVRIILWMPLTFKVDLEVACFESAAHLEPHQQAHIFLASLVKRLNAYLVTAHKCSDDIGVVFLDSRTATLNYLSNLPAAHHQKYIVVHGLDNSVAFCGGVDAAYTRRASPDLGDDQSGLQIPNQQQRITDPLLDFDSDPLAKWKTLGVSQDPAFPKDQQGTDLPMDVYGDKSQLWHDQHLQLQGPVVSTLEEAFVRRWNAPPGALQNTPLFQEIDLNPNWRSGAVTSSSGMAFEPSLLCPSSFPSRVKPLPDPDWHQYDATTGNSVVQVWQTLPYRNIVALRGAADDSYKYYRRGEFSILTGLAVSIGNAKEMILVFDQFLWSLPYARLLGRRVRAQPGLHLVVVLPPYSDAALPYSYSQGILPIAQDQHGARYRALSTLFDEAGDGGSRIKIFALWDATHSADPKSQYGVYCHAKVHMLDDVVLICGSANINNRGHVCDSELSCAVVDPVVVRAHYCRLLSEALAVEVTLDFSHAGWGKTLFDAFVPNQRLILDPWKGLPADKPPAPAPPIYLCATLPNEVRRLNPTVVGDEKIIDPSPLPPEMLSNGSSDGAPAALDDVARNVMNR